MILLLFFTFGLSTKKEVEVYPQSRNQFIMKKDDHHGFGQFVRNNSAYFKVKRSKTSFTKTLKDIFQTFSGNQQTIVFGEWAGKGIMKGASICTVPKRIFAVFAIQIGDHLIICPNRLSKILQEGRKCPEELHVLPYSTPSFSLNYSDNNQLQGPVDEINRLVEMIDKEDPYVKEMFGISGPGEGLVWYPVSKEDEEGKIHFREYSSLVFKTKGKKQ